MDPSCQISSHLRQGLVQPRRFLVYDEGLQDRSDYTYKDI